MSRAAIPPVRTNFAPPAPRVARATDFNFFLFILLNGVLFAKPDVLIPDLAGLRIYLCVIVVNILLAYPLLLEQLKLRSLAERPISACVVGIFLAVILSHLAKFHHGPAMDEANAFYQKIVYYLLLVGIIDSPA